MDADTYKLALEREVEMAARSRAVVEGQLDRARELEANAVRELKKLLADAKSLAEKRPRSEPRETR